MISLIRVLAILLCLVPAFSSYGAPQPARLLVTPPASTNVTPSATLTYQLTSTRAWVNWSLATWPPWLKCAPLTGRTPATMRCSVVNAPTAPGSYTRNLQISDTSSGLGTYTGTVTLLVSGAPPPPPPPPPPGCSRGYLLDGAGGYVLTVNGDRMTAC